MFYIYDCTGKVVGNPNGYRTIKGARQQAESRHAKAYAQIWQSFYDNENVIPRDSMRSRLIYSIK